MPSIKLTAKRQGTFPKELCDELQVGPGDELLLEARVIDGESVWILRPRSSDWSWIGSLNVPAKASHDMDDIRASVVRARTRRTV